MTAAGSRPPTRVVFYHCVGQLLGDGEVSGVGSDGGAMITPPAQFEAHIELLRERGYRFVTAGELAGHWRRSAPPAGLAVLTFDDGWRDGLTTVAPVLARLGVRATFFVCPAAFGNRKPELGPSGVVMTEAEARSLHGAGMELASHSLSHPDLRELSDGDLRHELTASREAVEALTGEPCLTLAYPDGWHDRRVERAVADAGYQLAFATEHGPWRKLAVPRVQAPTIGPPEILLRRLRLSPRLPA
ncbi:MAG TPA: polysaccharide deacetylase family protein [Solirubrobacteraceae bacterium]|nr:polysaccharide deacetylase family protein [Solirubrobacteraceae bacterium]